MRPSLTADSTADSAVWPRPQIDASRATEPMSDSSASSVATELALLEDIGYVTRDASICGLGQTALSAVQSAVKLGLIGAGPGAGSQGSATQ